MGTTGESMDTQRTDTKSLGKGSDDKFTLYYLNDSSAWRVLWLLEELGLNYDVQAIDRRMDRQYEVLKKNNVMGKSPQLKIPDGRVLIETSPICYYLLENHDPDRKLAGPRGSEDRLKEETLNAVIATTLASIADLQITLEAFTIHTPFFLRPLFWVVYKITGKFVTLPVFHNCYTYLNDALEGHNYLLGDSPGRPDFLLSFPLDVCVGRKYVDIKKYPNLEGWYERCRARPAYQAILQKGLQYNMSEFLSKKPPS